MRAHFDGPVHQVAGGQITNHFHTLPPPPGGHGDEATRTCPQCKRETWAYNRHCCHCQLDLTTFDRRVYLRSLLGRTGRQLAVFVVVSGFLLAASGRVIGAIASVVR